MNGPAAAGRSDAPAASWRELCADCLAAWAQVLKEASAAPPARAAQIYAAGAQRMALLLCQAPEAGAAPGGWLDVALRALGAGLPADVASAGGELVRALARLQSAVAALAIAEQAVITRGCALYGSRAAALAQGERTLRAHLSLWMESLDEAHGEALREGGFVRRHAAVGNALIDLTLALRATGAQCLAALDLPTRADLGRLEARVAELERELALASRPDARKPAPRAATGRRAPGAAPAKSMHGHVVRTIARAKRRP